MRNLTFILLAAAGIVFFNSCSTLEKASMHGFTSGYYDLDAGQQVKKVYADVTEEKIDVYNRVEKTVDKDPYLSIPLNHADSVHITPLKFSKQSIDIDLTTILMKYRPSVYGLPPQLTSDLNLALYAGWRHDTYNIKSITDPVNKCSPKIDNLGYDFGFFAGPGITPINPFTTNNKSGDEYSGMIIQTGIAGFLESNIASFGVGVGVDFLMGRDREIWIYNNKPWVGFIVGIAIE